MKQINRKNSQPKKGDNVSYHQQKRICSLKDTTSMEQYTSQFRLVQSQNFTIDMCINYLFQWNKQHKLINLLISKLMKFPIQSILTHIPTITFLISMTGWETMEGFAETLAKSSLSAYLIIRWSYSSFVFVNNLKMTQIWKNKLDSCLLKNYINGINDLTNQSSNDQDFHRAVQSKLALSNYIMSINEFYEKLFKIPEKLKKYQKAKRNAKLQQYLYKIYSKIANANDGLSTFQGIPLPICHDSNIIMRIVTNYSFTFSTKQRVPFKIVFETLTAKDAQSSLKQLSKIPQNQFQINIQSNKQSLILQHTYFGQQWKESIQKIAKTSPYSQYESYKIRTFMVKSGDDLRQQYMAMQLIKFVQQIIKRQNLKLWVKSYSVIPFNEDSGLIQFVDDTRTVSYLKQVSKQKSLKNIYKQLFGINWQQSILNFTKSLAGYSLIQYLFQIKDRHNNNILIDTEGHIIHIDFSFMISISPGNMNFQQAPFKFTQDYLQIMEGPQSDIFQHYRMLFFFGLKYIRKYKKQIMEIIMIMTKCQGIKCFKNFNKETMEKRFHSNATDQQLDIIVDNIMKEAWNSYSTTNYDRYQWYTNFIYT